jgi:hypothetical protein
LLVTTCPASDLHQRCKQSLGRAEIGVQELCVSICNNDKPHPRKIMSLGEHLGSNNNVNLAPFYACKLCL